MSTDRDVDVGAAMPADPGGAVADPEPEAPAAAAEPARERAVDSPAERSAEPVADVTDERPPEREEPAAGERGGRIVHSSLARPRRRSARDDELDLDIAERQAAAEALLAASDEEDSEAVPASGPLEPLIPVTALARADLSPAEIEAATQRAIEQLPGRSARVETCPFLRSIAAGNLQPPRDAIDGRNRCAALPEPLPLSRVQQGLVCLQPAHANCPRYVRGALLVQERIAPSRGRALPLPTLIAAALLALTILLVALYGISQGGFGALPGAGAASNSPSSAAATPTPTPQPQPSPAASASPSPAATPRRTPRPTPKPTPLPAQWRGLDRCGGGQNCFIYRVRRGDTLESIAQRFDTTVARLRRLNPEIQGDYLRVGQRVKVPPP